MDYQAILHEANKNTQVNILGDKDVEDLVERLKKEGIDLTKASHGVDLGGLKIIYTYFDRASANKEKTTRTQFLRAMSSLRFKPLSLNHWRQNILGFYVDVDAPEKKDYAIAYALFFKSHYPDLWKEVDKRVKERTLKHSWEILTPKNSDKIKKDGTAELQEMILSGGALLLGKKPAYNEAYVLATAEEREKIYNFCKEYCSEYDLSVSEVITEKKPFLVCSKCLFYTTYNEQITNCSKCGNKLEEADADEVAKLKERIIKDEVYVACPYDGAKNWEVLESSENEKTLRCLGCFEIFKAIYEDFEFPFPLISVRQLKCPNCEKDLSFLTSSSAGNFEREFHCPDCKLIVKMTSKTKEKKKRIGSLIHITKKAENIDEQKEKLLDEIEQILEKGGKEE